ncbi:MAG: hypothetical protein ACM34E_16115, partial [Acidobacteriota bacterium]
MVPVRNLLLSVWNVPTRIRIQRARQLFVTLLLIIASQAMAPVLPREAKSLLDDGRASLQRSDFATAIRYLEQARRIAPESAE